MRSGAAASPGEWSPVRSSVTHLRADQPRRDDLFLDLRCAIADLVAEDVAEALLERELIRPGVVTVGQQAGLDRVLRHDWSPPLAHGRLGRVWLAGLAQPERAIAQPSRRF